MTNSYAPILVIHELRPVAGKRTAPSCPPDRAPPNSQQPSS
jgi:hypothetical protein